MSKLAENIVRELLDDDIFVNECKVELMEIMKDKKFDLSDLPEVMSLVVLVVEKYDTFNVDSNDIVEVFRLLIVELLKKYDIIEEANPEINKMLESCLKLLVLKVKTKSFWRKLCDLCKCCKCCNKDKKSKVTIKTKEEVENDLNDIGEIELQIEDTPAVNTVNEDNEVSCYEDKECSTIKECCEDDEHYDDDKAKCCEDKECCDDGKDECCETNECCEDDKNKCCE